MKKLFWLLTLVCGADIVFAQYKVGDVYEKDGVKAVIFYVDKAGEEGLAITVSEKENIDQWYLMLENLKDKTQKKELKKSNNEVEKTIKTYYNQLVNSTCGYGAENMKAIKEFCAKNNVDMNKYFPAYVWAESLGEGWFVPGTYEASLYAEYIAFGVGKKSYKGTNKKDITNKYKELNAKLQSNPGYENLNLPTSIKTSTIGSNSLSFTGIDKSKWNIYKSLELREEQSSTKFNFTYRSDCYYDIDAYRPMLGMGTWVSYCNVAVCKVNLLEEK